MTIELDDFRVSRNETLRQALARLNESGSGVLVLEDSEGRLVRLVTDGDLRRLMLQGCTLDDTLDSLPAVSPVVADLDIDAAGALDLMRKHDIAHLPLVDEGGRVVAIRRLVDVADRVLLSTPHLGEEEEEFVAQAFRSNWIAPLGPNVDAFEKELAECVGINHAAALSSGTAALHLAMRLLDVGPGDTVFCSSLTFVASVNPVLYQGATPVFIDSEPHSWNMSPQALERALREASDAGSLPRAVVIVSLYGQSADMDPLLALCDEYDVPVVEDAAESLGATYKGRASGTFGRLGVYSFNGNKIITTSGGGMLVSDDEALIERARYLSTQAKQPYPWYEHEECGYNYRMSNILAGVGRGQLRVLEERVRARRAIFERYRSELSDLALYQWMPEPEWGVSTHWLSACLVDPSVDRDDLLDFLARQGVEARPVWKPMHLQPLFEGANYYPHSPGESVGDVIFARGVCLPSGSNMTGDQLSRIISLLREFAVYRAGARNGVSDHG